MFKLHVVAAVLLISGLCAGAVRAEEPDGGQAEEAALEVLLSTVRANRKALVAVNLQLTDEEATKFWPLYDRYREAMNEPGDRLVRVIQDYSANFSDLSNDKALQLTRNYLAIENDRVGIRRAYLEKFSEFLPGRKVARLYQIENKMDAVIRFDLASHIPVIAESGGNGAK